ncbi:MAG TPA: hypothetical protein VKU85_01765 [bacterium]|nr:hypothetical protein [bacterium]
MTPRRPHPDLLTWTRWMEDPGSLPDSDEMERHLGRCESCRRLVEMLREVGTARRVSRWASPPEETVWSALNRPAEPAPRVPRRPRRAEWQPLDVRGGGLGATGEARLASHALENAEVGIVAVPPGPDGRWRITGKVWVRGGQSVELEVVLIHDDHVVAVTRTTPAGEFELEEVVGPGWSLEVHLPDGTAVTLAEPAS